MGEKKWFWIRWNADGDIEICSPMFDNCEKAFEQRDTFKGETLCETIWRR